MVKRQKQVQVDGPIQREHEESIGSPVLFHLGSTGKSGQESSSGRRQRNRVNKQSSSFGKHKEIRLAKQFREQAERQGRESAQDQYHWKTLEET